MTRRAARRRSAPPRAGDATALAAARGAGPRGAVPRRLRRSRSTRSPAGDAETAREWLLLREFRTATRFTRPDANATLAVAGLARGDGRSPTRRAQAVAKDLLDAYQARQRELLGDADAALEKGFATRHAETAAQAAGYWPILAAATPRTAGAAAAERDRRRVHGARARRGRGDAAAYKAARADVAGALDGFTAAPFTDDEAARRAQQLLRFLALVPVEYDRGVERHQGHARLRDPGGGRVPRGRRGRVRRPRGAARQARRAPAREAVEADLDAARRDRRQRALEDARRRCADAEDVDGAHRSAPRRASQAAMPKSLAGADRRVRLRPDRAHARPHGGRGRRRPVPPGRAGAPRGLRVLRVRPRAAPEVVRPGPRARRRGPDLVRRPGPDGPRQADRRPRAAARDARDARSRSTSALGDAAATLGDSANKATVVTNSAIIVFREGLEARADPRRHHRLVRRRPPAAAPPVLIGAVGGLLVERASPGCSRRRCCARSTSTARSSRRSSG